MLGLSPLPRTLEAALRDVKDKRDQVRISALRDLARHACDADAADRVREALEGVLASDPLAAVRGEAAVALADAGAVDSVPALLEAAYDVNLRVRQMALLALGEVATPGDRSVLAVLHQALDGEAAELRFQGLIACVRLDPDRADEALARALGDSDEEIRYMALRLAEEQWLASKSPNLTQPIRKRVVQALKDDSASVRLGASILLGRMQDARGAKHIAAAVNDRLGVKEPEDEQAAIDLAGELEIESALRGLRRRAFSGPLMRDSFAWQARVALARQGDERAVRQILRALSGWTRDTRTLAVVAAGRAGLSAARSQIEAMVDQPGRADPTAVADALAALEDQHR